MLYSSLIGWHTLISDWLTAGSKTVFGELWFHAGDKSVPPECRRTKHEMQGEVAEIENIVKENGDIRGDTLTMLAKLTDHTGSVR